MSYKVTLSMPVYNVAPYVERALLSALNQTFDNIEFLIVDDKGTDNSMDIVRKVIENHPRGKDVRIIEHPHNIGTGATKNTAIDNAQGEYLFFLDSDDEITPDCIEILYNEMTKDPVDFVASSFENINLDGEKKFDFKPYKYLIYKSDIKNCIIDYLISNKINIFATTWNKLYNIEFLRKENIRCMPKHINEDLLFFFQLSLYAKSFTLLPNITYKYYVIKNSITDKESWSQEKATFIAIQNIEILEYKSNKLAEFKNNQWYYKSCCIVALQSLRFALLILECNIKDKKNIINKTLNIPYSNFIPKIYDKVILLWILSKFPYFIKKNILKIWKLRLNKKIKS